MKAHTLRSESPKGRVHLEVLDVNGDNIKVDPKKLGGGCDLDSSGAG
jgi:hypothetical protein